MLCQPPQQNSGTGVGLDEGLSSLQFRYLLELCRVSHTCSLIPTTAACCNMLGRKPKEGLCGAVDIKVGALLLTKDSEIEAVIRSNSAALLRPLYQPKSSKECIPENYSP